MKYVVNNIPKHRYFTAQQGEYNILLRQYKQLIQRKKRQYQQAKLSELENMRTEDPNCYWKFWKSLNPIIVPTGPTLTDFVNYFEQQVYPPHVDYFDHEHINNIIKQVMSFQHNVEHDKSNMTQFLNSPITAEKIKKAIQKLKCKKAAGVDGISAEFYKYGCNELLSALELLFNTILTNGEYPSRWATGLIHPVHKKGTMVFRGTGMIASSSTFRPHTGRVIRDLFRLLDAVTALYGSTSLQQSSKGSCSLLVSGYNLQADCQWRTLVPPLNSGANAAPASVLALM